MLLSVISCCVSGLPSTGEVGTGAGGWRGKLLCEMQAEIKQTGTITVNSGIRFFCGALPVVNASLNRAS